MARLTMQQAVVGGIAEEMRRDRDVFIMGLDIGRFGGPLNSCKGLWEEFGPERVIDTPISEGGIVGAGVGAALMGKRPIVDIMFLEYLSLVLQQVGCDAGAMHYYSDGKARVPLVVRAKFGVGPYHGHAYDYHAWVAHVPGVKVAIPSSARDAKGMIKTAIRDDNPVLFLEHMGLYHGARDEVPDDEYLTPFGEAAVLRRGDAVTLVSVGAMVRRALQAAEILARDGIEAEVIDLRTIVPLDKNAVLESVARTGRLVVASEAMKFCGSAGEVVAIVAEEGFRSLKAPIERVATPNVPIPFARNLEKQLIPGEDDIVAAARRALAA
ncbi:MAG TPA: pyruvate dehydrogenase complex E1 component subunit beta [Burkholderiaceae bacterium]|nr:pyruvate dehydrogenase complex E1 component subunit beta [Burkholderiaceae bacterium]